MPLNYPWKRSDTVAEMIQRILLALSDIYDKISGGGGGGGGGVVQQGARDGTAQAWLVDGSATTQPISAAALPLPAGASTSALQTTGNTSLASLDTKLPAQGAALIAASTPVNIASNQTVPVSAVSLPLPAGSATAANQATEIASLASIDGKLNSLGQKTSANSVPVVIASDQSGIPTTQSPASAIVTGANDTLAAAGTAQQLGNHAATRGVYINAPVSNSGMIYVGDVNVTNGSGANSGIMLTQAGSLFLPLSNSNLLYWDADTTGDKIYYTVI